jgi:protocatechuate 3,4-dioxygenase beta subunit
MGRITHVAGRVLTRRGAAVRGAMVEIWQCDANGNLQSSAPAGT